MGCAINVYFSFKYILFKSRNPSRIFNFFPYVKNIKNLIKSFVLLSHGLDVGLNLLTLRVILMWKKCKIWSCTQAEPLPRVSFSCHTAGTPLCKVSHGPRPITHHEKLQYAQNNAVRCEKLAEVQLSVHRDFLGTCELVSVL